MNNRYWAVMKNGEAVLTTIEADADKAYDQAVKMRNTWARYYTGDVITVEPLRRRAQAEQVSAHGRTEARGWER